MISHGKDIKIFTGNANPKLADEICKLMGTKLGEAEVGTFSDGEIFVSLYETSAAAMCSWSSPPAPPSTTTSWSCSS